MERLTGSNYSSLVEAYASIYEKDSSIEINEESDIQEFLEAINTLVEEGYDLSKYTYDELYEDWKTELAKAAFRYGAKTVAKYGPRVLSALKGGVKDVAKVPLKAGETGWKTGMKVLQHPVGATAATVGAVDLATHGPKSWTGKALSSAKKAVTGGGVNMPSLPTSVAKPAPEQPKSQSLKILGGKVVGYNHFDPFDVIKGHLLDEGYADTEEAALAIMANMSEEWRQSIVESAVAQRAAAVVDDQRRGSYGMADDLNKTRKSLDKLKPYPDGFPNAAGVKGA